MTSKKQESSGTAVFLDWASLSHNDIDQQALNSAYPKWEYRDNSAPKELPSLLQQAEIVVSNKVVLDLDALPESSIQRLKLICVAATGYNNINLDAAKRRGVSVCNVRDYATASVTQHVFAMLLCLTNHLIAYHNDVHKGLWSKSPFFSLFHHPIGELSGKIMGIIGYGVLGRSVASMAQAMGMKVVIAQHSGLPVMDNVLSLDDLLRQSDVVSVHCPLNEKTQGLIGSRELELMKSDAILINAARGGIVDEAALVDALRRKRIAAAALDVLTQEPPPFDHPLIKAKLGNLLLTPHIAWASQHARQSLVNKVADNIRAFRSGQPTNLLD